MGGSPVWLDLELCKACGICIELCPDKVFDRDKQGYPVVSRPEECSQCLICELHCPDFAIEIRRRVPKAKGTKPAAEGAPAKDATALSRDDLIAATSGAPGDACGHHDEEG
ncbi:MAG: ferredoxin family protein [Thermoleophilia bacterium]|nr:ferredoxin family protein [Thermoleophilia bacterium]